MLKSILRDRGLLVLISLAVLVKLFSLREDWVERWYTGWFYPPLARVLRAVFGWIPFSVGDVLYIGAFLFLVAKTWKFVRLLAKRRVKEYLSNVLFRKYLRLIVWIYLIFNVFWGLNYNRTGIAGQLGLDVKPYTAQEVAALAQALQVRLNHYAEGVDSLYRLRLEQDRGLLFGQGVAAYGKVANQLPYLTYSKPSIKPSIFSPIGHLFGFTGYYNPFSGEAQLKMSVPVFVKPFIVCHEIAHQVGYAKENEANFVAFIAGRASDDPEFRYSSYYDMYSYAARELAFYDTAAFSALRKTVHPRFRIDYMAYRKYLYQTSNMVEPVMSEFYDRYLKMNNQPLGKATYNEVVAWLVAYMRKYGREAI